MRERLISAAVLVPVVVIVFLVGPPWLTLGIAVLAALASYETAKLLTSAGLPTPRWFGAIVAPLAVLGLARVLEPNSGNAAVLVAPAIALVLLTAAVVSFRQRDPTDGLRAWIGLAFASLYPAMLAFLAAFVGFSPQPQSAALFGLQMDEGRLILLVLVLTVWTTDSGAYLSGRMLPRGRMAPHISPNKTWSGAMGGTLAAMVVAAILWAGMGQSVVGGALIGLVVAVAGQAGDLAESVLKRAAGAKDSGSLIPGHGGILDRVDSFLFAAPALYATLALYEVLQLGGVP